MLKEGKQEQGKEPQNRIALKKEILCLMIP